jgi:hypothetical protein
MTRSCPRSKAIRSPWREDDDGAMIEAQAVEGAIDRIAIRQPRELVEGRGIPKAPRVPPCSDQRVLYRILRRVPVAEDPSRDRVQAVVRGASEGIEGLVVAPLCAFDEFGRHRRPPRLPCGPLPHLLTRRPQDP